MNTNAAANWPENKSNYSSPSGQSSVKWRGVSLTEIRNLQHNLSQAGAGMMALRRAIQQDEALLTKAVEALVGQPVHLGRNYECLESPTLDCVYPKDSDEEHCMFCDEPSERP